MATIPVTPISALGTVVPYSSAAGGGDQFANTGNETVHIKNGDVSSKTATFTGQTPCDQGSLHNLVLTIGAGVEYAVKGLNPRRYNDGNRMTQITYSAVTSVTLYVES
jgi:hypothetical protein